MGIFNSGTTTACFKVEGTDAVTMEKFSSSQRTGLIVEKTVCKMCGGAGSHGEPDLTVLVRPDKSSNVTGLKETD